MTETMMVNDEQEWGALSNDRRGRQVIVDGPDGVRTLLERMARHMDGLVPAKSWSEVEQQAPSIIRHHVDEMKRLLQGQDLFDVLELVRQHEIPITLAGHRESESQGIAAIIDIVALVALGVGQRTAPINNGTTPSDPPYPNQIIEPLCALARDILKLAALMSFSLMANPSYGPLVELASQLRGAEQMIRGKHYQSIGIELNRGILDAPQIASLLKANVGFTYDDVRSISDAIRAWYAGGKNSLIDRIGDASMRYGQAEPPPDDLELLRQAFSDLFISPGTHSSFTAADLAEISGVTQDRILSALQIFSRNLGGDSEGLITAFVNGRNPLAGIDIIGDGSGNYLMLQNGVQIDHVRRLLESRIKAAGNGKAWDQYGRRRDAFAEEKAGSTLASLLGMPEPTFVGLKYLAPSSKDCECDLSASSSNPRENTLQTEGDALFIVEDVAICLEVKAGAITDKAKSGNVQRVAEDLKKTIGEATTQAQRLESLLLDNHGLWLANGKWLDLSGVREVRSVVACLDDFGPLAIAADALVRAGLLGGSSMPWIVSIHDLAVVEKVIDDPASFLLYLRRRTEPSVAKLVAAIDELDVLMWFLHGGLYFEADPDALFQRFPRSPMPTSRDRTRYREQIVTRVGTLTDKLDAWMYFEEGISSLPAPKPTRAENPMILGLVKSMQNSRSPGWLRSGADLLNLSSRTQTALVNDLKKVVEQTRRDGDFHSVFYAFMGAWGYSLIIIATQPRSYPTARNRLSTYMAAKKHQLQADRAVGFLIDEQHQVVGVEYRNDPPGEDADLDELVERMHLVPVERMRNTLAPSPKRLTPRKPKKGSKSHRKKK
ncbi:hypothetical protein [Hamadaea tsunoensis]|uniref:hypothetical protein n=1 Tax=Hamadaea tsunoensis TaxID=53368 RepID=UPI0012F83498|nr:hypothetical protein [Hamadaea tsunoensis]